MGGEALMGGWMTWYFGIKSRPVELPLIGAVAYRPPKERDFPHVLGART